MKEFFFVVILCLNVPKTICSHSVCFFFSLCQKKKAEEKKTFFRSQYDRLCTEWFSRQLENVTYERIWKCKRRWTWTNVAHTLSQISLDVNKKEKSEKAKNKKDNSHWNLSQEEILWEFYWSRRNTNTNAII